MELTLPRLPSMSGLNWMFWSQACTPSQNQKTAYVLVFQFLKLLRPPYNSLVPHHQWVHWKSYLWQDTTYVRSVGQKGRKRNLMLTSAMCWVPLHRWNQCSLLQNKASISLHTLQSTHSSPGGSQGFGTLLFPPARKLNHWMEADQNTTSEKNCDWKYLLPFFLQNAKMSGSYFFPSLFSPFLGPFARHLFWWCPRHFSLLTTTLQTEQASK